jgi:tetratricopeptide (TPR) repeat protein
MSRKKQPGISLAIAAVLLVITPESALARPTSTEREAVVKIVIQIQKADYEGNRADLQRFYGELTPFANNKEFASRVLYWRGFALWRRAINGFNDNVDKADLGHDLQQAAEEFEKSAAADPSFVDSKIALGSCYGLLAYSLGKKDAAEQQALAAKSRQALKDAQAAAPDNPRLLWVLGPVYWNIPVERGGGQDKALQAYEKGLETIRSHKDAKADPLDPSWGEAELLMSLAWSDLNRATPDLKAAEQNASAALQIVPYWHYVRDILMQQIRDAKAKQGASG